MELVPFKKETGESLFPFPLFFNMQGHSKKMATSKPEREAPLEPDHTSIMIHMSQPSEH